MFRRLVRYLLLPDDIVEFEHRYFARMNRVTLWFFVAHVPVMTLVAALNGTGAFLAFALTSLWLLCPIIALATLANPRHVARAQGFTAMAMGALLVHFGQGPMQIEMHFYFFVLIALLAVFADPLVIVTAAVTVAAHHAVFFVYLPKSVFNYDASIWTVVVHAVFVVLESVGACFVARSFFDNVIGLDRIVQKRTDELEARNHDMRLLLDNVGEGFFTVDLDGQMSKERSRVLEQWLGHGEGAFGDQLGRVDPIAGKSFELGWEAVVEDILPLDLTLDQLPKRAHAGDHILALSYRPLMEDDKLARVLVHISDITPAVERERAEADQREMMQVFDRLMRDRAGFVEFFAETTEMTRALVDGRETDPARVRRLLHTLKGNSAVFGLDRYSELCHKLEDKLAENGNLDAEDRAALEGAYHRLAARLSSLLGEKRRSGFEVSDDDYARIVRAIVRGVPRQSVLQMLSEWKLEPAEVRLQRVAEQARATAQRMGKHNIEVVVDANGVRVPVEGFGHLWSSLVHAIRNALDHGMETPEERIQTGKHPSGTITLSAARRPDALVVSIEDDGRGVDWHKVANKAHSMGMPTSTPQDLMAALFVGGVSTKDATTEYSGRGVGMSAVQEACREVGGDLHLSSVLGKGTRLEVRIPPPNLPAPTPVSTIPPRSAPH